MLISEIIELAEAQSDETYAKEEWLAMFNRCQDDLTPVAKALWVGAEPLLILEDGTDFDSSTGQVQLPYYDSDFGYFHQRMLHRILDVYIHLHAPFTPEVRSKKLKLRRLNFNDNFSKGWKEDSSGLYLQGLKKVIEDIEYIGVSFDAYLKLPHFYYDEDSGGFCADPDYIEFFVDETGIPSEYHGLYVSYLCAMSQQREEENEDYGVFLAEYNKGKAEFTRDRIAQIEPWNLKKYLEQSQGGV